MLPGGSQRHVGIQGREQPAARPGSLPPQREHGGLTAGHHIPDMHLDQLGHAGHGAHRAGPDQASKAITVGSLRCAGQRPAASQIRQPGRRGREAQVQPHLGSYEHLPIRPGTMIAPPGTKVPMRQSRPMGTCRTGQWHGPVIARAGSDYGPSYPGRSARDQDTRRPQTVSGCGAVPRGRPARHPGCARWLPTGTATWPPGRRARCRLPAAAPGTSPPSRRRRTGTSGGSPAGPGEMTTMRKMLITFGAVIAAWHSAVSRRSRRRPRPSPSSATTPAGWSNPAVRPHWVIIGQDGAPMAHTRWWDTWNSTVAKPAGTL